MGFKITSTLGTDKAPRSIPPNMRRSLARLHVGQKKVNPGASFFCTDQFYHDNEKQLTALEKAGVIIIAATRSATILTAYENVPILVDDVTIGDDKEAVECVPTVEAPAVVEDVVEEAPQAPQEKKKRKRKAEVIATEEQPEVQAEPDVPQEA